MDHRADPNPKNPGNLSTRLAALDRPDNPIPLDDLWGKTEPQAVADLIADSIWTEIINDKEAMNALAPFSTQETAQTKADRIEKTDRMQTATPYLADE